MVRNRKQKPELDIEHFKQVEKAKLDVWMAKTFTFLIIFTVGIAVSSFAFIALTTTNAADWTSITALISEMMEVVQVIIEK